jgi:hypothetical protein
MGSKNEMTRKEFFVLTFTLVGSAAAVGACSSDNNNVDASFGGNNGSAGTTGGGGTTGHAGSGGTTGTAGSGGTTGTGGGGGTTAAACSDPLPETQSVSDHTHTLTIAASTLNATTAQTFDTGLAAGHMHMVTLEPAQLTTLKGGSSVMVTSSQSAAHTHVFTISCH